MLESSSKFHLFPGEQTIKAGLAADKLPDGAAVEFIDTGYRYASDRPEAALDQVNLRIEKGEFVALIGANGCGKSTLAKLVNALLLPSTGRVLTMGLDTAQSQEEVIFAIRSQAGLILQNPDSQIVASVVADDIAFGPENLCVPHEQIVERVESALAAVKMSDRRHATPTRLSGGQKQRICIAGMLAMQPRLLVLDEPGEMLDIRGRRGVRRILRQLHEQNMTLILITQSMEEAVGAQRVVVMDKGRVLLTGSPRQVFTQQALLEKIGLDVPFSVRLAAQLRQIGLDVPNVASPSELLQALLALRQEATGQTTVVEVATALAQDIAVADDAERDRAGDSVAAVLGEKGGSVSGASRVDSANVALAKPAIALRNVRFAYSANDEGSHVLRGLSLELAVGGLLGIIGHTGSGKTTLLQLIAGLMRADSGSIRVAGLDVSSRAALHSLHALVGMVFQYPERQFFAPTVEEEIAFGPKNAGLGKAQIDERVRAAMRLLNLDYQHFRGRSPFELSGGEKRRVAIASVIAADPEILIFDEPSAGLDISGQHMLRNFLLELKRQRKTVVLASHSMDLVAELASEVLVLDNGRVAMQGSPSEVFTHANARELRRLNLGLPQPAQFALDLNAAGFSLPEGIFQLADLAQAIAAALGYNGSGTVTAHIPLTPQPANRDFNSTQIERDSNTQGGKR